jgi:hypothetical protein
MRRQPAPPSSGLLSSFHHHSNTPTYHLPKATSRNLLTTRYKTPNDPPTDHSSSNFQNHDRKYTAKNTSSAVLQAKRSRKPLAELEKEHRDTGAGHLGDNDPATHESWSLTRVASQTAFSSSAAICDEAAVGLKGKAKRENLGGPAERLGRRSDLRLERPLNKRIVISRRTGPVGRTV